VATLEMETFHLFHLAACWTGRSNGSQRASPPPLATNAVSPVILQGPDKAQANADTAQDVSSTGPIAVGVGRSIIRSAAAHMVFASRNTKQFITPEQVNAAERWAAQAVLEALIHVGISQDRVHPERGGVWETV